MADWTDMAEFSKQFDVGDKVQVKTSAIISTGKIVDLTTLGITIEFPNQFSGKGFNFHPWTSVIWVTHQA